MGKENGNNNNGSVDEPRTPYHPAFLAVGVKLPRDIDASKLTDEELDKIFHRIDREGLRERRAEEERVVEVTRKAQSASAQKDLAQAVEQKP